MRSGGWRWTFVVGLGLTIARASAAEPTADEHARLAELLRKGDVAAKAKDWQACVAARWAALQLQDAANIAGDLGLCEEQAGRFGDAMNHVLRALADATPAMEAKEPWRSYQAAVLRMRSKVAMVTLTLEPTSAFAVIDGRPYGKADGRLIAMSYGQHTFAIRAEGYEDASETHLVTRGTRNIDVALKPKPKVLAVPAPSAPVPTAPRAAAPATPRSDAKPPPKAPFPCLPAPSARGVLFPLACATAAAFVTSAATTIGFEVHAASMRAALAERGFEQSTCAPGQPGAEATECTGLRSRVRQRTDAANVMIGTGIATAVLAAGVGLSIALERKGPTVTAAAGTDGGAVLVQGTW